MKTPKILLFLFLVQLSISMFSQNRPPIIDMHMHTGFFIPFQEGAPPPCIPQPCEGTGHAVMESDKLLKKTLEYMDRYNVVIGLLSGEDLNSVDVWKAAAPERFIASPFILEVGKPDVESLRQDYEKGRFAAMGEIGVQLTNTTADDPAMDAYFALAEELDLPVLIHNAGIGPPMPGFHAANGSPLFLEKVFKKHPKLRLFVENTSYPYRDEMITMMYMYPQLYGDLSTISWIIPRSAFYDYLKAFIDAGLGKRLMFGSDQMIWPEKIGAAVEAIEQAPFLTEEQKRDIFYNNAARFLRLDDEENTEAKLKMRKD